MLENKNVIADTERLISALFRSNLELTEKMKA